MTTFTQQHQRTDRAPATRADRRPSRLRGQSQTNAVHRMHALLHAQFKSRHSEHIDETTPAGACLRPLLAALQWMGRARHLAEALPHFNTVDDVDGLRAVLANINYTSAPRCISTLELHRDMLPCLFEAHGQPLMVVLSIEDGGQIHVFEGSTGSFRTIPASDRKGTAYVVQKIQPENPQDQARSTGWMYGLLSRFRHTFTVLLSLSLVINLLALAVPIYIMGVYEKAIGAQSMVTLVSLFAGVCLVIAAELFLRKIRGRALTYLGTRIENIVVIHVFQKLLHMPVSMTETASIGSQLTRFRQFEGLRDIFSGTLANALLDLPFLAVFIVAVFAIGGPLGFIPVGLVLAYVAMAAITVPMTRSLLQQNGGARTRRRNLMMEITSKYKSIRDNQAGDIWLQRFADANSHFLLSQFRVQQFNVMVQTLAQSLVIVAGGMTIGIGTLLAMDGVLTNGALIAATALVWRGLSPLQSAFLGLNQIGQAIESFRQINHLVRLPQERDPGSLSTLSRTFVGKVTVQDAGLRYTAKTEPALRGVSLRAEAGELIAITGPSGAGKSTLLKIIGGLHQAQIGAVCIDDLDIRQFDVADVRQSIGYVPQKLHMFYGTIAQNIRLAQPTASQDDTEAALEQVGALEEIRQLPDGVNTRIFGINENRLSSGLLKQISLARAFIKRAPIYLLDEPGSDLDRRSDAKFIELLKTLKGKATIILVTHRPSHLWLADRVIVLNNGRVAANAPPEKIVPSLFGTPSPAGKTAAQASANTESTSKHQDQPTPQLPREGA